MLAAELIDPMLPALKPTDLVGQALAWMEEHRVGQLVLTDQGDYRGIVSEELLMDVADDERPLRDVMCLFEQTFVNEDQHMLEVLGLVIQHQMEVIAVISGGS